MNVRKMFWVELLVVLLALSFVGPAFSQGRPSKTIAHTGVIEWVSRDFKYIGINEGKVSIPPETKIVDKQGNILSVRDLKRGRFVLVEIIRNPDGSRGKRVIIKR